MDAAVLECDRNEDQCNLGEKMVVSGDRVRRYEWRKASLAPRSQLSSNNMQAKELLGGLQGNAPRAEPRTPYRRNLITSWLHGCSKDPPILQWNATTYAQCREAVKKFPRSQSLSGQCEIYINCSNVRCLRARHSARHAASGHSSLS